MGCLYVRSYSAPHWGLNSYNHPKSAPQVSAHSWTKALTWEADMGWLSLFSPKLGLNSYNHPKSAPQVNAFVQLWALTWGAVLGWL